MEQPTLAPNVHNPALAPNISITSATATEGSVKPNRPPLLRRVSRSEAHLDLPQWNMPEKDTNTWQRKLSGLFEVGSSALNLSKLVGSRENVYHHNTDLQVEQPLERKLSALELGAAENKESNIPLRKSSTVAELQPFPPVSRLEIKHQASSSSLFNYPTNLDHHHDQGLTMNVRAPAAAATLAGAASIATGLGGHSGASDNSANLQSGSSSQSKGWGFFSGSFLSKPAYKNEEENRRYIMAFDRY